MQLPKLSTGKKKTKQIEEENPIEAIRSIGSGLKTTVSEESKAAVNEAWDQILGATDQIKNHGGELTAGHEIDFSDLKESAHEVTEMGRQFAAEIVHAGTRAKQEDNREMQVKMQEILIELKQLAVSTKDVQAEVEVISQETNIEMAGAYNLNFMEKMLSWLRDARADVEDSLAWFQALRSKKASRQYGTMAKKHGTSFTLSNERTAATQTG